MRITTTTTSKGQLTIPKAVRDKLGLRKGTKVDIYLTDNGFVGRLRGKSRLLEFAGDLQDRDTGETLDIIRAKAEKEAVKTIIGKAQKQ